MKQIKIIQLRPSQMAIGFLEVQEKVESLKKLKKKKLKAEIRDCEIDVIIGPKNHLYIIDGHHRVFAYWLLGIKSAPVKIKYRFPKGTSYKKFWKKMHKEKWAHLYNESGDGPIEPLYLAQDIRGIGNDPYRSLAWLVRENGGYKKTDVTFADFQWAQLFRKHKLLRGAFTLDCAASLPASLKVAASPAASRLPGFKKKHWA